MGHFSTKSLIHLAPIKLYAKDHRRYFLFYYEWYLISISTDVENWIASKDIQFFHRGIHLFLERWQNIIDSDERYFD